MLNVVRLIFAVLVIGLVAACSNSPSTRPHTDRDFARATTIAFDSPSRACFVLLDPRSGHVRMMNPQRAHERFPPASTFKIPNSLIGLDTGVIPDADYVIAWDGTHHEREVNNQDHSLRTAMRYSVVWYYQELARRVGESRMKASIDALGYGNADISSGLTTFWLRGSIRISANEQVAFLRRLQDETLRVSPHATAAVKEILVLAQGPNWVYRGKTGTYSGLVDGTHSDLGWFVGWIERDGQILLFAANDSTTGTTGPHVKAKVETALVSLGVLPVDWTAHQREVRLISSAE